MNPNYKKLKKIRNHRQKKLRIYRYFNGLCFYCHLFVPFKEMTIDHLIPKSKNGDNTKMNLVLSCYTCNQDKGNLTDINRINFRKVFDFGKKGLDK